jgi:hypothetical protein
VHASVLVLMSAVLFYGHSGAQSVSLQVENETSFQATISFLPSTAALVVIDPYEFSPPAFASKFPSWYRVYLSKLSAVIELAHAHHMPVIVGLSTCNAVYLQTLAAKGATLLPALPSCAVMPQAPALLRQAPPLLVVETQLTC